MSDIKQKFINVTTEWECFFLALICIRPQYSFLIMELKGLDYGWLYAFQFLGD